MPEVSVLDEQDADNLMPTLKLGVHFMLLRNIDQQRGLCNRTRVILRKFSIMDVPPSSNHEEPEEVPEEDPHEEPEEEPEEDLQEDPEEEPKKREPEEANRWTLISVCGTRMKKRIRLSSSTPMRIRAVGDRLSEAIDVLAVYRELQPLDLQGPPSGS
ncbi:ATP-dependent DNA helicase PIF1-like protein [Tanacetum coccineum]|uniref:ATP-dependent DNA helicase PIF1-like protein n=1 Tax=Tanacetum coccineum TaxID=301880 RepID=A0ABQ5FM90_9ASTR